MGFADLFVTDAAVGFAGAGHGSSARRGADKGSAPLTIVDHANTAVIDADLQGACTRPAGMIAAAELPSLGSRSVLLDRLSSAEAPACSRLRAWLGSFLA